MSRGMWHRTLIYLGLKEEPEDGYDELSRQPAVAERTSGARGGGRDDEVDGWDADRPSTARPGGERYGGERPGSDRAGGQRVAASAAPVREPELLSNVRPLRGAPARERAAVVEVGGFDEVEGVAARYRTGQPVVFDLSAASDTDARRVIDFVSGVTYSTQGTLRRVGRRAFLLTPTGVDLPADEQRRLAELGYDLPTGSDT